ncbi:hypothetical protein HDR58_05945 [bacterium]|nr:hypothetical protein [bacterium]
MQNKQTYITTYLLSLSERSYKSNKGDYQIGFDWIIYQYGLSQNWQPIRYPFHIENKGQIITHKTEAEFGIDFSFYDQKSKSVIVFLLKAEKLTYNNWIKKDFDSDLRRAINPDLTNIEIDLEKIKKYKIIIAYNKNDDQKGIDCYETFIKSAPKKIYETIDLEFERWNIDRLTEEVTENLLTADILPNNLSGLLSYISLQVADFEFGTKNWENQLIPNWKNFLEQVFTTGIDERKLNLIPFSLIILKNEMKKTPIAIIGWYDLIEYAILKLWDLFPDLNEKLRLIVISIWREFYINELIAYFEDYYEILTLPYGINNKTAFISLNAICSSYTAYWHLGRLGILYINMLYIPDKEKREKILKYYSNYIEKVMDNNPSCYYPLVDINHIELYLVFISYLLNDKKDKLHDFFLELGNFFCIRRTNRTRIPFIEGRNRLDLVAEYVATGKQPIEWNSKSSYLLTMLLEMFTIFDEEKADKMIEYYFNEVIASNNEKVKDIDLVSWYPDNNWQDNIFKNQVVTGTGISTSNFYDFDNPNNTNKQQIIKLFIKEMRTKDIDIQDLTRPLAAFILACIKYQSPLPPEFWRIFIDKDILIMGNE